jgi:hypothetical protein
MHREAVGPLHHHRGLIVEERCSRSPHEMHSLDYWETNVR